MMVLMDCKDRFTGECILSKDDYAALHVTFTRRAATPLKVLCARTPNGTLEAEARQAHRIAAQLRTGDRNARAVLMKNLPVSSAASEARGKVRGSCNETPVLVFTLPNPAGACSTH